jgi:hypothetical protein
MKRGEVRSTLQAIIAKAFPAIPVYLDGSDSIADKMEKDLQTGGVCMAIGPILYSRTAEKSTRVAIHGLCAVAVHLRMNPALYDTSGHDTVVASIQSAVLAANGTKPSPEWSVPERDTQAVPEDLGCYTTALFFTASILTT